MMNNKLVKNIKYIIVTILAIFCVCNNAKALRSVDGLANDATDVVTTTPATGTIVSTGNTRVDGVACPFFNVSVDHNASVSNNSKNAAGKYVGPYIMNQGNMMYKVVGADAGCVGSYVAFCLDPNFDGVKTGQTLMYKAEPVNPNSTFGRRIYALYKIYQQNGSPTDEYNYFSYEVAARILAVKPDSNYQSRSNTAKARLNSHLGPYLEGNVPGNNNGAALAQQAMALAETDAVKNVLDSSLGISLNQVGGIDYNGSSYSVYVNVNVQNCQSQDCVPDNGSAISIDGGATLKNVSYDAGSKTKSFTYEIGGLGGGGCIDKTITASLNYNSDNDARSIMQISPVSAVYDDRQNYIVFGNTGGQSQIRNSISINNCKKDPTPNSCASDAELACDKDDENFVVVNEGSIGGGPTRWEDCIIGHTDANGNSYDVVNTSKLYRNEDEDSYDRTDAIIGYTSYGETIKDSDFCIISCKEKYAFILPGNKKEVKQGTYFSFQVNHDFEKHAVVGVSAERTCVSSNMKTDNFNKRVIDLRKQQLDYLNMYLYYKQIYNAMLTPQALTNYRANYISATCSMSPSEPSRDYEEWSRKCNAILRDDFNGGRALKEWNGSGVRIDVKYYALTNPSDLNSDLVERTRSVTLNQSFYDAFPEYRSLMSFYNLKYRDYRVWNNKLNVDKWDDGYEGDRSRYHYHGYNEETYTDRYQDGFYNGENGRETRKYYENGTWWYEQYWVEETKTRRADEVDEDFNAVISNYINGSENWDWSSNNVNDELYTKYREEMAYIKTSYTKAKQKYEALNAQIGVQADAMQECTNYLDNFSQENNPYRFDPIITFSYPSQSTYMKMLAPNRLENMNEGTPEVNYEKYFCASNPGSVDGVFSCHDQSGTTTKFKFPDTFSDSGDGQLPQIKEDIVEYYNAARVGSRATYGRYNYLGQEGCSSSYRSDSGSRGDYCYEFYQSAKQFYTQAPDGVVTTNPSGDNKTILSTDGRVYPVAITTPAGEYPFYLKLANIGQFGESSSLGRIMGGGDGKGGTMSGDYGDTEVCYYEVCRVDDPDCGNDGACADLVQKRCNNGAIDSPQYFSDDDYESCLQDLMKAEEDCCSYVKEYIGRRTGKWANLIPTSIWTDYSERCEKTNACTSFTIISSDYASSLANASDLADVDNNGSLQVNARAVSLNNLFPNEQAGINWLTSEAQAAVVAIETLGEGVFANDCRNSSDPNCHGLDYSAVIDAKCAERIRQYNAAQEGEDVGYGNGGFNDYTDNITNANTNTIGKSDISDHKYGTTVQMDDSFRNMIETYCSFEGKAAPDLIIDNSSLVLEPWQYN